MTSPTVFTLASKVNDENTSQTISNQQILNPEAVARELEREISLKHKIGPFLVPPFKNFVGSPMGAIPKKLGTPAKWKGTLVLEPNFQMSMPKRQGPAALCLNLDDTDTSSDFGTQAKRKGTLVLELNFQKSMLKRQGPAPLCLHLADTDTSSNVGSSFGECESTIEPAEIPAESTINLVDNRFSSREPDPNQSDGHGLDVSDLVSTSPSQPSCSRSSFGRSKGMYV